MKQKNKFYKDKFLDLSSYNFLEQNVDESWDTFVEKSPQGTVFSKSYFLYAFKKKKILYNDTWGANLGWEKPNEPVR